MAFQQRDVRAGERAEQGVAGGGQTGEAVGGQAQLGGQAGVVVLQDVGLGDGFLRERDGLLFGGLPLGAHGEHGGGGGDQQQCREQGHDAAEVGGAAFVDGDVVLGGGRAGVEERLLGGVEGVGFAVGPVGGLGQGDAAVQ
ncbi:hypothetical protein BBK82_36200 [Lentzea guizhouensis]|uniref:Uncharacterized protein n=1 Tax=Lentzea guizhouensis TaxID=1586287 RepID=A0A1B2HSD2_9PSEU|nr:hypothetical protein [Lentzea guizhouensis]ANZ40639.1 hypothetical protein BBK82_36200 [Lentzea guizhouensis]